MKFQHDFSTNLNFFHQPTLKNKDGKEIPYGPWLYKRISEECYYISHQIHTSYTDLLKMSVRERGYLLEFVSNELKQQKESLDRFKQQQMENIRR